MKLKPYKELIAMSADKLKEAMAPIRAKQTKSKAQMEMANIEAEVLELETKVQELCVEKDINFSLLLDKLDKIAILERRKKQYSKVLSELFPED